jgi:hypothetical protein
MWTSRLVMPLMLLIMAASLVSVSLSVSAQRLPSEPPLPRISPAGLLMIDWWRLGSYDYNPLDWDSPTPKKDGGIVPPSIRKLNGAPAEIVGNILPLDFDRGGSYEFILNATVDACGFGGVPRINEWVQVSMKPGEKTQYFKPGDEVLVRGKFFVKEVVDRGRLVGLYSMVADSVTGRR